VTENEERDSTGRGLFALFCLRAIDTQRKSRANDRGNNAEIIPQIFRQTIAQRKRKETRKENSSMFRGRRKNKWEIRPAGACSVSARSRTGSAIAEREIAAEQLVGDRKAGGRFRKVMG
jgi:hypothetical protein